MDFKIAVLAGDAALGRSHLEILGELALEVMFLPVFFMPCRNVFNGKGGDCVKCLWRRKKGEGGPVLPAV